MTVTASLLTKDPEGGNPIVTPISVTKSTLALALADLQDQADTAQGMLLNVTIQS